MQKYFCGIYCNFRPCSEELNAYMNCSRSSPMCAYVHVKIPFIRASAWEQQHTPYSPRKWRIKYHTMAEPEDNEQRNTYAYRNASTNIFVLDEWNFWGLPWRTATSVFPSGVGSKYVYFCVCVCVFVCMCLCVCVSSPLTLYGALSSK